MPPLPESRSGASLLSSLDGMALQASLAPVLCLPLKIHFYLSAFTVLPVTDLLLITMETEVENVKNTTQEGTESKEFSR